MSMRILAVYNIMQNLDQSIEAAKAALTAADITPEELNAAFRAEAGQDGLPVAIEVLTRYVDVGGDVDYRPDGRSSSVAEEMLDSMVPDGEAYRAREALLARVRARC